MLIDLHTHTTLSDGTLTAEELVAAAERRCYRALAITDHASGNNRAWAEIAMEVRYAVDRLRRHTPLTLFAGVELTDLEPDLIPYAADVVRRHGAQVVVVHGECVSMAVNPGTNASAVRTMDVDVLAHPGLISEEDAREASRRGIYLELSARPGHNWANGHVYQMANRTGASLVVDSDGHDESGLLSTPKVAALVRGAGAPPLMLRAMVEQMAPALIERVTRRTALPGSWKTWPGSRGTSIAR